MSGKLDPLLRARVDAEGARRLSAGERVEVIVEFTGDPDDLIAAGFASDTLIEHPREGSAIATGTILVAQLDDLAAVGHVVRVHHPRGMRTMLDYSVPETRADQVHTGSPSRKGSNVVIGIIDTGIDWRHRDFVDFDDRTSRIVGIWDQLLPGPLQAGETAGPGGTGVVYTQDQLNRAVQGLITVRTRDLGTTPSGNLRQDAGHGTHVAGIAAGDGSSATCCHGANTYVGMAPLAGIIMVRSDLQDSNVIRAMNYIFTHPAAAGKPVVVNMSFGSNIGPHDGTDPLERAINNVVAAGPARVVVVSAGNSGDERSHVRRTVPPNGNVTIDVTVGELEQGDTAFVGVLDLWYGRAGTLNLTVNAPGGVTSGSVAHGTNATFVANPGSTPARRSTVNVYATINDPGGRDNNFRVVIGKPTSGSIPAGPWTLTLTNPTATAVAFHCWLAPERKLLFLPPVSPPDNRIRSSSDSTLTSPAMAAGAISVANYASKTDCCDCWPTNDIVASSSRGPLARGAAANPKPDIAAPGLEITAANADAANLRGNCCDCCPDACCVLYVDKTGTSMAAPHVTGAIALLLEENPHLTKADILRYLQAGARPAPAGGTSDAWGAGKLDVLGALAVMRAEAGGGGGGGGGGPRWRAPAGISALAPGGGRGIGILDGRWLSDGVPPAGRIPGGFMALRVTLAGLPEGERLAAVASRHFSEVRRLINTNRRVATMWHRANGPRLLRELLHAARGSTPGEDCPCGDLIHGERERRYLDRFFDQLDRYGSARLRASLATYRATFAVLLQSDDVPLAVGG